MTAKRRQPSRKSSARKAAPRQDVPRQPESLKKGVSPGKASPKKESPNRLLGILRRRKALLALLVIAGLAFFIRCLHLFDSGHFYIISADSHLFHWMADRVMQNQPIPTDVQPSGLAYPLAYLSEAFGFVFQMSNEDALAFVSRFLPPLLGALTAVVIYLAVSRMYDRRMGLCSALAWAVLPHAYFIQGAGYLDRDGLNVPLIMVGALAFYASTKWHPRIRGRDIGWLLAGLLVVGLELVLFLEWSWLGPALLLAIVAAFFLIELLLRFLQYEDTNLAAGYQSFRQRFFSRARAALKQTRWQAFALIISLNALVALTNVGGIRSETFDFIGVLLRAGSGEIAEMGGLRASDLVLFQFFILLIPIGLFLIIMRLREADLLFLSWFVVLFILSLFARRIVLYATPAAAVIGALVVANLLDFQYSRGLERNIQKIVAVMTVGILVLLSSLAHSLGSEPRVAATVEWQEALEYIRDNTEEDARIMTWWDYGYWILDMAQREPVVDGGLNGHSDYTDDNIGWAYCTSDASEAVEVMKTHSADYLVFSTVDLQIMPVIASHAASKAGEVQDLSQSLYYRSVMDGTFQSEDGLERVYPDSSVNSPDVVVLRLNQE